MNTTVGTANIELGIDSTRVESGSQRAVEAIARTGRSLATLGQQGSASFNEVSTGSTQAATRVDAATRSLIGSIQRTTAAMDAGSRGSRQYFEALANQRGVDANALRPYLDALDAVNNRQRQVGVSAGQVAAAMRQVPAQFTDIVTSLQGGQNPLTVLLQQGGQLRDSFGSTGTAARALGGYIAGLVNPYTVAAGAAVALAVAYNQGSKETDGYNRSLILTGNAAATTADQMTDMARAISKSVGTQGDAAEALAALAGTGQVGAENLQRFGLVAVEAQRAIGKSIEDTAKDFEALGNSPLQATERLNETYRYLTASVYEQIKALEMQGRLEEAADLAQKTYADAMEQRSKALTSNLGTIEKAWKEVKDWAKGAWDAMLDVGRADTLQEKLESVQKKIQAAKVKSLHFIDGDVAKQQLVTLREQEASLQGQIEAQNKANAEKDASNKLEAARIAWLKEGEKYLSRQQQLDQDITKARNEGAAAGQSQAAIEQRIGEIRKKYSDLFNAGIDSQIEALKRREAISEEVENRSKTLLDVNRSSGLVNEKDYIEANAQLELATMEKRKSALQQELALTAGRQNSIKEQAALRGQIALADEQMLSRRIQLEAELSSLEVQSSRAAANAYADLIERQTGTRDSLNQQVIAQRDYNDQIGVSAQGIAELAASRLDDQAALAEQNAELADSIDLSGVLSQTYIDQAKLLRDLASAKREGSAKEAAVEAAKEAQQAWKQTAQQIENSLEDALMRGFESGKSFAENLRDTVVNMFKTMVLKPTIQGMVTGSVGGGGTTNSVLGAAQTASGLGNLYNTFAGIGGTVSGVGNLVGSTYLSALGSGLSGGASVTEAIAAYEAAAAAGVSGAATTASGLAMGSSISTALAAIPGWGWAAIGAAAIVGMSGLFGDGPESDTRLTFTSNNTPGQISINERGNEGKTNQAYIDGSSTGAFGSFGLSSTFWMSGSQQVVQDFIKTVTQVDDALSGFLTADEKASVTSAVTGKSMTAHTGAEGSNPNAAGQLDKIFAERLNTIFDGIEPGLSSLLNGFDGTSQQLATEAASILQFRKDLDDASEAIFGASVSLQDLVKLKIPSEATSAALSRVVAEFKASNVVLDALGISSEKAFGAVGLASEAARKNLAALAGGVDVLASQGQYFTQNFLSKAEQLAPVQKQLATQLADLGYAGLTTADQYRDAVTALVSSGALATESGAKTYESLLALAPAFKTVTDAAKEAASAQSALEDQIFELTHTSAEVTARKRQEELAAMDATLRPLQERIYALQDEKAAQEAVAEAAAAAAEEAAAAEAAALQAAAAAQEAARSALQSLGNSLVETMQNAKNAALALRDYNAQLALSEDSPLSATQKVSLAKAQFESADKEHVQEASSTYLDVLKQVGVTGLEYAKAYAAVQSRVAAAAAAYDGIASAIPAFWAALNRSDGSHASGLDSVPFDGYRATLHRDEKVLTSAEAGDYRGLGRAIQVQNTLLQKIISMMEKANLDTSFITTVLRAVCPDGRTLRTTSL